MEERKRIIDPRAGQLLRNARERIGLSQLELARLTGLSRSTIEGYEQGRWRIPADQLTRIASALHCEPAELLPNRHTITLIDPLPLLGFYARDLQTNTIRFDPSMKAICGLAPDAHIEFDKWHGCVHKDDLPRVDAEIVRCFDPREAVFNAQYRLIGHDDIERYVIDLGHMSFQIGKPAYLLGVALDITRLPRTGNESERIDTILTAMIACRSCELSLNDVDKNWKDKNWTRWKSCA